MARCRGGGDFGEHRARCDQPAQVAERASLTVLHYDRDFELIAGVTGRRHEWVVAPGIVD